MCWLGSRKKVFSLAVPRFFLSEMRIGVLFWEGVCFVDLLRVAQEPNLFFRLLWVVRMTNDTPFCKPSFLSVQNPKEEHFSPVGCGGGGAVSIQLPLDFSLVLDESQTHTCSQTLSQFSPKHFRFHHSGNCFDLVALWVLPGSSSNFPGHRTCAWVG